eukprot:scaffold41815_cov59-Phaeocystis_antarctica.AAC.5
MRDECGGEVRQRARGPRLAGLARLSANRSGGLLWGGFGGRRSEGERLVATAKALYKYRKVMRKVEMRPGRGAGPGGGAGGWLV